MGSLHEIETKWSLIDLLEANEVLDVQDERAQEALEEVKRARGLI